MQDFTNACEISQMRTRSMIKCVWMKKNAREENACGKMQNLTNACVISQMRIINAYHKCVWDLKLIWMGHEWYLHKETKMIGRLLLKKSLVLQGSFFKEPYTIGFFLQERPYIIGLFQQKEPCIVGLVLRIRAMTHSYECEVHAKCMQREIRQTYECVLSHIVSADDVSHSHVNESWHIWMSHGTYEWVVAYMVCRGRFGQKEPCAIRLFSQKIAQHYRSFPSKMSHDSFTPVWGARKMCTQGDSSKTNPVW